MASTLNNPHLSLAFMRTHPERAARVLEALPTETVADLFVRAPARVCAYVLAAMLPQSAARCLAALDDDRVQQLLAPMGTQPIVAVLRCFSAERRQVVVSGLPTALALASTLLMGYAEDTLGALADPDVLSLPPHTRAADALQRLQASGTAQVQVFVADAQGALAGVVTLPALLQAPAATTLASLMKRPAAVLAASAPVSAASAHPGWELASSLPVLEAGDRLVGVLNREVLARAQRRAAPQATTKVSPDAGLSLLFARGYWQVFSGALEAGLVLLPNVPPLATDDGEPQR